MNKEELIKAVEELPANCRDLRPLIDKWTTLELIKLLEEPEKVKVPQFVADWIEYAKFEDYHLLGAMDAIATSGRKNLYEWFRDDDNMDLLAQAWILGYEVEEEKRYKIALLNRNDGTLYLVNRNAGVADKYGHFSPVVLLFTKETKFSENCYELTKQDVVLNGFGWVFDCEGIEIEEVE